MCLNFKFRRKDILNKILKYKKKMFHSEYSKNNKKPFKYILHYLN